MSMLRVFGLVSLLWLATGVSATPAADAATEVGSGTDVQEVYLNDQLLSAADIQALADYYDIRVQAGRYWYDPYCGAWGAWGGPTAGFVQAGIPVAPLPANASNGSSGVFINGRNITLAELSYLESLAATTIIQGHYWLDALGNAGAQGAAAQINFLEAARSQPGNSSWYGEGASGWSEADGSGGVWIANPYGGTGTTVSY